ncbi:MAG: YkgJ family cysteine cluster protein [Lentimicrobium sp.]|jgi:Fe-S-cluster containining protein|nr:YkgJ family cysteine cluster protein [Lentimicrobium sp.]
MKLETNIENIAEIAERKRNENISFSSYLKGQDIGKIDEIVHRLYEEIGPQIDCLSCGNCCLNLRPVATDKVLSLFVEPENIEEFKYLMSFPCKNLSGKKCTIYSERPEECRSYPYMHRDKFVERTHEILQNYEICPIVFNIFELLKKELGWIKE